MNTNHPATNPSASANAAVKRTAAGMALQADQAIADDPHVMQQAADSIQDGLDSLRNNLPAVVTRLQTQTETYVRDQPVKAVLLAVAAGAFLAKLLGRSNRAR